MCARARANPILRRRRRRRRARSSLIVTLRQVRRREHGRERVQRSQGGPGGVGEGLQRSRRGLSGCRGGGSLGSDACSRNRAHRERVHLWWDKRTSRDQCRTASSFFFLFIRVYIYVYTYFCISIYLFWIYFVYILFLFITLSLYARLHLYVVFFFIPCTRPLCVDFIIDLSRDTCGFGPLRETLNP